jgi:hypothetical protein
VNNRVQQDSKVTTLSIRSGTVIIYTAGQRKFGVNSGFSNISVSKQMQEAHLTSKIVSLQKIARNSKLNIYRIQQHRTTEQTMN